jgi:hypothetical protein
MGDGAQKPIEQVRVLDEVLTAEGNVKRVIRTMVRREAQSIYRLHVWGHRHLRATGEHPILTESGYKQLSRLSRKEMVALPRYAPATKQRIIASDYYPGNRVYTMRAKGNRHMHIPGKRVVTIYRIQPPDVFDLTAEFGWIIGVYLAEGSTSCGKVTWSFSITERDTHVAKLVKLLRDCFGVEANVRELPHHNLIQVKVYGTLWAKLFESWCAVGCDGKRIHPDLCSGPPEFLEEVLRGWTDGDGLGPNHEGGVTVSHQLALGMFDIANALGKAPRIETLDVKVTPKHGVESRRRRYIVRWPTDPGRYNVRGKVTDKYTFRPVDGVVREDFDGWVYNLEVEDDNSYVAEGVGVHNCNASAICNALEAARKVQGLPFVHLSAGDLYNRISGGVDQGSTLQDGMYAAMNAGVADVGTVPYLDWQKSYPSAAGVRPNYRALEAFLCPQFDHAVSAVIGGFFVVIGIPWFANYNPDSQGWLPSTQTSEVGGHAMCSFAHAKRGTTYGLVCANQWTSQWGMGGYCIVPEPAFSQDLGGMWAIRAVVDEGGVIPGGP